MRAVREWARALAGRVEDSEAETESRGRGGGKRREEKRRREAEERKGRERRGEKKRENVVGRRQSGGTAGKRKGDAERRSAFGARRTKATQNTQLKLGRMNSTLVHGYGVRLGCGVMGAEVRMRSAFGATLVNGKNAHAQIQAQ